MWLFNDDRKIIVIGKSTKINVIAGVKALLFSRLFTHKPQRYNPFEIKNCKRKAQKERIILCVKQ